MRPFSVYVLFCGDGSYYVGQTDDLAERVKLHPQGKAARYTRSRRPVALVYSERYGTRRAAKDRERQIKGWSRDKKQALIAGDIARLRRLSRPSAAEKPHPQTSDRARDAARQRPRPPPRRAEGAKQRRAS